jgi:hypothetical protein
MLRRVCYLYGYLKRRLPSIIRKHILNDDEGRIALAVREAVVSRSEEMPDADLKVACRGSRLADNLEGGIQQRFSIMTPSLTADFLPSDRICVREASQSSSLGGWLPFLGMHGNGPPSRPRGDADSKA